MVFVEFFLTSSYIGTSILLTSSDHGSKMTRVRMILLAKIGAMERRGVRMQSVLGVQMAVEQHHGKENEKGKMLTGAEDELQ